MGVTGLWRLIEPAGKPVPVETLENKVLAVDISIWLHQMVKGYQDAKGAPLPNAHLMGLFQRLCKLLYFRIKPVFVFDGGFPDLKKETIAKRQDSKAKYNSESKRIKRELALLLSKKSAISSLLGKDISPKKGASNNTAVNDDLFKLPALPESKQETESESEDEDSSSSSIVDLHSVDIESSSFKNMPAKEKYDLLIELKETRKMNSWGKLNELPKKSDSFSDFQMQRLLKRRKVQECLEETEKEIGDSGMSLNELESLLNDEGIDTKIEVIPTRRIASNDNTRFLLINNVKQALLEAKKKKEQQSNPGTSKIIQEMVVKEETPLGKDELEEDLKKAIKISLECVGKDEDETVAKEEKSKVKDELEEDLEKAIKMSLECVDDNETSNYTSRTDDSWTSVLSDTDYSHSDSEEGDGYEQPDMSSAKAYIMQYSDFTSKAIDQIIASKYPANKNKPSAPKVDNIIEQLNKEKSVILDEVNISSDEDCSETQDQTPIIKSSLMGDHKPKSCEDDVDLTQASVLFVENSAPEVVTLDTSGEDNVVEQQIVKKLQQGITNSESTKSNISDVKSIKVEADSSEGEFEEVSGVNKESTKSLGSNSSDDEFEDVPEIENQVAKPVVELTLDMGQECDEDDIFADVFTNKEINNVKTDPIQKIELPDINNTKDIRESISLDKVVNEKHALDKSTIVVSKRLDIVKEVSNVPKNKNMDNRLDETKNFQDSVSQMNDDNTASKNNLNIDKSKEKDTHKEKTDKTVPIPKQVISVEKLNEMAEVVCNEEQNLVQEKSRLDRIGRNITEQMTKEAQELLQLFGIPYIVAPMEAEAQCAFLENIKLTDGTITDDSDIWLFGGKTVYKNFFNQKKHVLQFVSERIEKSFNLTREQLILLALLVGSDYTTGVDGVGPVTAMEILASFPFNKKRLLNETSKQGQYQQIITGMQEFKSWVRAGKRTDNTSLKKKLRNVTLTDDFPSVRVVQAYLEPNVEKSDGKFSWGEIDITILRDYTKAKFGWSQNKLDEIIKPVFKRLQERKSQKTVHDYFKRKVEFQSLEDQMSKRVKAAVQKMGPEELIDGILVNEGDEQNILENSSKPSRKRKIYKDNPQKSKVNPAVAGPSKKVRITTGSEIEGLNVKAVAHVEENASGIDIIIPKSDRFQEIIPQREKDKQSLLQNKMKAIEIFRKTKIDRKKKVTKKKVILPKEKADLSESSDGD